MKQLNLKVSIALSILMFSLNCCIEFTEQSKLNMKNVEKLKKEMVSNEVIQIMGKPDTSFVTHDKFTLFMYSSTNVDFDDIKVYLKNDSVKDIFIPYNN